MIAWQSDETHLLLNPRMPVDERQRLERLFATAPSLRAHIWIATSGTTGSLKLTALSKEALLASAAAVNRHLDAGAGDIWCCVLPTFHVGGLGIQARAMLAGARLITMSWDPHAFARTEATLASLVPAQVHDLVRLGLQPPPNLRLILVGGGAFDSSTAPGW